MAETVNPQITDAVTQTNVKVLAEAPAMAMGALYQTMSHSLGLLMENAVTAQQNMNIIGQALSLIHIFLSNEYLSRWRNSCFSE